jgi:hypothetical protein
VEESESVARHHGRHRQGPRRLRIGPAESRRGERLPAASAQPMGQAVGALDADGEMGRLCLSGETKSTGRPRLLRRAGPFLHHGYHGIRAGVPSEDEEDKYSILPYFWIPEETLDLRVKRDHVNYDLWKRQGSCRPPRATWSTTATSRASLKRLGERYNIREIAFDRWGACRWCRTLRAWAFTVVPFGQGFKDMSPPTKELMKLTLEKKIAHGGHPVLRWMMDNIFIRTDPAATSRRTRKNPRRKIDGAVATIMALDRAIRCGNDNWCFCL